MEIYNNIPHSPFFIFINGLTKLNNIEILKFIGFDNVKEVYNIDSLKDDNCIYLSTSENWVNIMDNGAYELYYSKKFNDKITELSKTYNIFMCSVGECDKSFEFKFYNNSQLTRHLKVDSPKFDDQITAIDLGTPLKGEVPSNNIIDELEYVIKLANSLEIDIPTDSNKIKCYDIKNYLQHNA